MRPSDDALRALALRGVFDRAARAFADAGVPMMPLKGILLAYWVYPDPAERLGGDVDVLVPPERWDDALRALKAAGFRSRPAFHWNPEELTLLGPTSVPIELDVHRALFAPGRYRARTADLFRRGRADSALYGLPVVLPDPLDVVGHLIGHAAADHRMSALDRVGRDLDRVAERFALSGQSAADHLVELGLGRAARLVLGLVGRASPFGEEVRRRLPAGWADDLVARAAAALMRRSAARSPLSIAAGFLANTSLGDGVGAAASSLANRIRFALGRPPTRPTSP